MSDIRRRIAEVGERLLRERLRSFARRKLGLRMTILGCGGERGVEGLK
jgi:hypothetical protein